VGCDILSNMKELGDIRIKKQAVERPFKEIKIG